MPRLTKAITQNNTTLQEATDKFLQFKAASKIAERTLKDYHSYLQGFIQQSQNSLDCEKLKDDVLSYFSAIPDTSPAVFNHPYQYIHSLMSWLVKQDYITYNPFTKLDLKKRRDDGNIKPLTEQQLRQLYKSLRKDVFTEYRDYCIVLLMADTGIRTSELLRLRVSDFDEKAESIYLDKAITKTSKNRVIYLQPITITNIMKLIKMFPSEWGDGWLFPTRDGKQLTSNVLARNFRLKYSPRLEFDVTPYQLRHTFATLYLRNGGDVFTLQKQMGHSDLSMTKRYADISEEDTKKAHKKFSPLNEADSPKIKTKLDVNKKKK